MCAGQPTLSKNMLKRLWIVYQNLKFRMKNKKKTSTCILHALLINFLFHSDWSYWQKSVIPSTETHENIVSTISNSLVFAHWSQAA